jgi:hypothetical protein
MPNHTVKPDAGQLALKGQIPRLIYTVTSIAIKRNWPWIALYAVITIVGIVLSYFLSGWQSVLVSFVVALTTFGVGLVMWHKVITITNEVR